MVTFHELREAKGSYQIIHNTFTSAIDAARKEVEKQGYELDDDEMFSTVGTGPKKPSDGKTNRYTLALTKKGKPQKKSLHMQIYGMGNKFELNMYVS